jgi:hypothetical protein
MLDSVDTAIPVGSTVVCQVHGQTGYIIGSLNNTSRTPSGAFSGNYLNAPVPRPSNLGFSYTNFSARQVGTFGIGQLPFTVVSTTALSANGNSEHAGFWFYGANAFSSLYGKTIETVEIFVSPLVLESDSYPVTFFPHYSATRPSTTFALGSPNQNSSNSGWVTLSTSFVNDLKVNLNAWGIGFLVSGLNQTANLRPAAPYGTLRVGWTQ